MQDSGILFHERQRLKSKWIWALLLGVGMIGIYLFLVQIILGMPVGDSPGSDSMVIVLTAILTVGVPLFFIGYNMDTVVHSGGIRVRMIKATDISTVDIDHYHAIRFNWLTDYMGIGYRYGKNGLGLVMGGSTGVMFHLKDGKKIMIESDLYEDFIHAVILSSGKEPGTAQGFDGGAARI